MSDHDDALRDACIAWQGGRDGGSSPIRAAARILTQTKHYFEADFITRLEAEAETDRTTMSHARVLLDDLARRPARTVAEWSASTGIATLWAGRGIKSAEQNGQIMRSITSGTITMPLWGLSLSKEVALSFGDRFLFELTGPFPAIPAWEASGIKLNEQELIAGGKYNVTDITTVDNKTEVRLRYDGPVWPR